MSNDLINFGDDGNRTLLEQSSPALQILFDDRIYERVETVAQKMAKSRMIVPPHLIQQPEACFAVVVRALVWRLDPFAVAASTFITPDGKIGYEGKLCQAIIDNSGKLQGGVTFHHYGEWNQVMRKFEMRTSQKGKKFPVPTWNRKDAEGLGVTVKAQIRGETEPRTMDFDLIQAFPLNSTLWATDPKTQIKYTAVRRFASSVVPGLLMGVPFDYDVDYEREATSGREIRDVTPPPRRSDFDPEAAGHTDPGDEYSRYVHGEYVGDEPSEEEAGDDGAGEEEASENGAESAAHDAAGPSPSKDDEQGSDTSSSPTQETEDKAPPKKRPPKAKDEKPADDDFPGDREGGRQAPASVVKYYDVRSLISKATSRKAIDNIWHSNEDHIAGMSKDLQDDLKDLRAQRLEKIEGEA